MRQVFAYGIATAAATGFLVGGVMKLGPEALDRDIIGPQILVSGDNTRDPGLYPHPSGTNFASYTDGEVPEYVYGTDWTRPMTYEWPANFYVYEDAYEDPYAEPEPVLESAVFMAPVKVTSPPTLPRRVTLPSRDGDILAGVKGEESAAPTLIAEALGDDETLPS